MKIPVIIITDPAMGPETRLYAVEIQPGGSVIFRWPGWGYARHQLTQLIADEIATYFRSQVSKPDYYWRGTNNMDEIRLIRSGRIRPSLNHVSGLRECGLSVADHLGYLSLGGYLYGYRVRGRLIGAGSDGEPVLALDSLEPLDDRPRPVDEIEATEGVAYRQALQQAIAAAGWTPKQYQAAIWGNFSFETCAE